ncbi:MAG: hypothetical protein JXB50_12455 [Spirochaetes bacterium]|nr:hypothetical protein [Spirochaetota bacterium]
MLNNKTKYYLIFILLFFFAASFIYYSCTTPTNPLSGVGKDPDLQIPTITITSHNNNDTVQDIITLSGTYTDDKTIESIELYKISGTETKLGNASFSNNPRTWNISLNTHEHTNGSNIFKVKVTDNSDKSSYQNITLTIDNSGPYCAINKPDDSSKPPYLKYYQPFEVSITAMDPSAIIELEWELTSDDDNNVKYSNNIIDTITELYSFIINPENLRLVNQDHFIIARDCTLRVRVKDELDQWSDWDAVDSKAKKVITIDFTQAKPTINIENPEAATVGDADIFGSDFTVTGSAQDDSGVTKIVVCYKKVSDTEDTTIEQIFTTPLKYQQFTQKLTSLTADTYMVRAYAEDADGNSSGYTEYRYFIVNTSFPIIEFTNPDFGTWQRQSVNIQANVRSDGGTIDNVELFIGDNFTLPPVFTATPMIALYPLDYLYDTTSYTTGGEIKFYIRATDNNGNQTIDYLLFSIDNTPPVCSINVPSPGNSGLNQDILIQGTASDLISTGVPGIVDNINLNIPGLGDINPTGLAEWSYTYDSTSVALGTVTVTVTVTDLAGNTDIETIDLNIDQNADIPLINVTNLTSGAKIYGIYTIGGTAEDDDAIQNIQVRIDSGSWELATGLTAWSYKLDTTLYSNGPHTFECIAYDIYNKPSAITSIPFVIDPDLPVISITSHNENDAINTNTIISGSASKSTGTISSVEIRLQGTSNTRDWTTTGLTVNGLGTSNATFSYTIDTAYFGEGAIAVSIRAKDDIDKINTYTRNLVIDTQLPSGVLTLPAADTTVTASSMNLAGSCSDPAPSSGLSSTDIWVQFERSTGENFYVIDGTAGKQIVGAVSNWTYLWNIPSSVRDGLYTARLIIEDRAGNNPSATIEVANIRLARYTSILSNLYINGIPVTNNMFITQNSNFTGHISDNNGDDFDKGVYQIQIYLSDDNVIDAGDGSPIVSDTWGAYPTDVDFDLNYSFSQKKNYIIYRVIDKVSGIKDTAYQVNIDHAPPTADFKYTSRDYAPATQSTNPGYSAIYWIKLDANDDNDMSGATVQTKLGTTSGGEELVGLQTYTIGDYMKCDLKNTTNANIYLWYKINDKAGNQTTNTITLARDSSLPTISSTALNNGYLRNATLTNVPGTATGGGQTVSIVKLSAVDGNLITGYDAAGTTNWTYTIPEPSEGDHSIIALVTANNGTNWYETFNFTYDNTPPSTTFNVTQITGGRVLGNNLSGTIRFFGTYTDNFDDRYSASDFTISINLDGTPEVVPDVNKTKNGDGTFSWYYEWNTENHPNIVKNNISLLITCTDKAGNSSAAKKLDSDSASTDRNIVPYITHITPVIGKVVPVYGYSGSIWENLNDNQNYSYRLSSGEIEIKGYNLNTSTQESITYTRNNGTPATNVWAGGTGFTENMNTINLDLTWNASQLTNGNLKITVGSIDSNTKNFYIIKNYQAPSGASGFSDIAETDMTIGDDNFAKVVVQKHFQSLTTETVPRDDLGNAQNADVNLNGSGIYRLIETAEETWQDSTLNPEEFIFHGYNRFWFLNVIRDQGTAAQTDGKYYLFTCDSENDERNTKGLYLTGRSTFWSTLPNIFRLNGHGPIWQPSHDWNFSFTGTTAWNPPTSTNYQYLNRWRIAAANGYNSITGLNDWSVTWGDLAAKNDSGDNTDYVYTVWFSQADNKMHYRRLNNANTNSIKSPAGVTGDASIIFNIKGNYPAITLDNNSPPRPVIICFDEINGDLVIYAAGSADPQNEAAFTKYTIDSTGVVGAYPDIAIDSSGNIHIVYHDITNAQLKYAYASTYNNLASNIIVIDDDSVPGYYCDLTLMPNLKPSVTYLSYGYLGTGNAIRTMRFTGSGTDFTERTEWTRITLPCVNNIFENKVRGYYYTESTLDKLLGFGKSNKPEFFREKP